jgi:hypothetical protein
LLREQIVVVGIVRSSRAHLGEEKLLVERRKKGKLAPNKRGSREGRKMTSKVGCTIGTDAATLSSTLAALEE